MADLSGYTDEQLDRGEHAPWPWLYRQLKAADNAVSYYASGLPKDFNNAKNLALGARLVMPGTGIEQSTEDARKAAEATDPKMAVAHGLNSVVNAGTDLVPGMKLPLMAASLIGVRTPSPLVHHATTTAQWLEKKGRTPEEVFNTTKSEYGLGVEKFPDQKYRLEVPDVNVGLKENHGIPIFDQTVPGQENVFAKLSPEMYRGQEIKRAGDLIDHPELFEHAPYLKQVPVVRTAPHAEPMPHRVKYDEKRLDRDAMDSNGFIQINSDLMSKGPEVLKRALVEGLQRAIQKHESFSPAIVSAGENFSPRSRDRMSELLTRGYEARNSNSRVAGKFGTSQPEVSLEDKIYSYLDNRGIVPGSRDFMTANQAAHADPEATWALIKALDAMKSRSANAGTARQFINEHLLGEQEIKAVLRRYGHDLDTLPSSNFTVPIQNTIAR